MSQINMIAPFHTRSKTTAMIQKSIVFADNRRSIILLCTICLPVELPTQKAENESMRSEDELSIISTLLIAINRCILFLHSSTAIDSFIDICHTSLGDCWTTPGGLVQSLTCIIRLIVCHIIELFSHHVVLFEK